MAYPLHLPSLSVEGFRGISSLELVNLGRITLLAGKHGVGKTTILEAIKVFASRGDYRTLSELLRKREEFVTGRDEDGDTIYFPDLASLFHNYCPGDGNNSPSAGRMSQLTPSIDSVAPPPNLTQPPDHAT